MELLAAYTWPTGPVGLGSLTVRVDELAARLGVAIHAWEIDGLGPARGFGGRGRGRGTDAPPPAAPAATGLPATPTNYSKRTPEQGRFWNAEKRWPCAPGPWGELVAVNAATGDIAWRSVLGGFEELEAKGIKTGTAQLGGAITTAGNLVFIGATIDSKFRAFDVRSGTELWSDTLDAPAHSVPSTYLGRDGKQYVAIPAGHALLVFSAE